MGELERDTPTSRHIRPESLLLFGMVFPERSQVLRAYYQDVDNRRRRRAGEFEDELRNATAGQYSAEELIEQVLADERAGELFERAVQEAVLAADERKRRALPRAVASGLLASDEAAIDDAQTTVRAIAALEPAHVRALLVLARVPDSPRMPWGADQVAAEISASSGQAEALLAKLAAEGLARDATEFVPIRGIRGGPAGRSATSACGSWHCCAATSRRRGAVLLLQTAQAAPSSWDNSGCQAVIGPALLSWRCAQAGRARRGCAAALSRTAGRRPRTRGRP